LDESLCVRKMSSLGGAESEMRLYYAVRRKSIPNQCFA
jgi:hypothetical protein